MLDFTVEDLSADEVDRLRRIYEPFTESVRALIDATIRTEVDGDGGRRQGRNRCGDRATAQQATRRSYGVRFAADGDQMPWGNVVIGVRNPVAPPLVVAHSNGGGARRLPSRRGL